MSPINYRRRDTCHNRSFSGKDFRILYVHKVNINQKCDERPIPVVISGINRGMEQKIRKRNYGQGRMLYWLLGGVKSHAEDGCKLLRTTAEESDKRKPAH